MTVHRNRLHRLRAVAGIIPLALAAMATSAATAFAGVYCVACEGPAAVYRCISAQDDGTPVSAGDRLACIRDIAKGGGHASCSVASRETEACAGRDWLLQRADAPAGRPIENATEVSPPSVMRPAPSTGTNETTIEKRDGRPPPGDEAAGRKFDAPQEPDAGRHSVLQDAAEMTGEAASKAGSAVSNAAKKTWRCLSSLFSNC